MIPLYGFLEGDTLGLLIFGYEDETVADLARKLQASADLRVAGASMVAVYLRERRLEPTSTLRAAGFVPLDRFDVVEEAPA